MLFLNGKLTTIDDLLTVVNKAKGTTYTRGSLSSLFRKNSMYAINPVTKMFDLGETRRRGRPVLKEVKGTDVLARFTFYSDSDGVQYELRYTDSQPYPDKNQVLVYKPKAIDLEGPNHTVQDAHGKSMDRMLYLFLHPYHEGSPFHTLGEVYKYKHINNEDIFEEKAVRNKLAVEALQHATSLNDVDVVIFAKSLDIPVQGLTASQARTQIQSWLFESEVNVKKYHLHMNDQSEVFIGRVVDAIDNRHIIAQEVGNGTVWSFNLSDNKSQIVTVPAGTDIKKGLINHIKSNPAQYIPIIHGLARETLKDLEFKEYFKKMETPSNGDMGLKKEGSDIIIADITTSAEAKAFYHNYFNRETSSPASVKAFFTAIQNGLLTDENVDEAILEFAPKS